MFFDGINSTFCLSIFSHGPSRDLLRVYCCVSSRPVLKSLKKPFVICNLKFKKINLFFSFRISPALMCVCGVYDISTAPCCSPPPFINTIPPIDSRSFLAFNVFPVHWKSLIDMFSVSFDFFFLISGLDDVVRYFCWRSSFFWSVPEHGRQLVNSATTAPLQFLSR